MGYLTNSMALVADSFHMLSDVIALVSIVVALVSIKCIVCILYRVGGGPGQYQDQSQGVEQEHLRLGEGRGGRGPHQLRLPAGSLLLHHRGGDTEVPGQSCLLSGVEH